MLLSRSWTKSLTRHPSRIGSGLALHQAGTRPSQELRLTTLALLRGWNRTWQVATNVRYFHTSDHRHRSWRTTRASQPAPLSWMRDFFVHQLISREGCPMETCSLLVWLIVWLKEAQSLASAGTKQSSSGLACWDEPDKAR